MANTMIIDSDTHFTEPADLWTSQLPAKWGDLVMQVRFDEKTQRDVWTVGDRVLGAAWGACAYRYDGVFPDSPRRISDAHPACSDQAERVKVMDEAGVKAAVLYPNVGGLNMGNYLAMPDAEIALAHCRAFNDYELDWAHNFKGRFIPMLVLPFWDVKASVAEIERMRGKGYGGVVMTGAPQNHGQPFIGDPHWYPIWEACVDSGLSVSYHIGNGGVGDAMDPVRLAMDAPGAALCRVSTFPFLDNAKQVTDLLLSGVLVRYPELKVVSVESGIGWVPFILECVDYHFKQTLEKEPNHPWGDILPSDLFHRQMYVTYWFEKLEPGVLEKVGEDNIMFETDFPHWTSLSPDEAKTAIRTGLEGYSDEVVEKILWRNAEDLYHLDVTA